MKPQKPLDDAIRPLFLSDQRIAYLANRAIDVLLNHNIIADYGDSISTEKGKLFFLLLRTGEAAKIPAILEEQLQLKAGFKIAVHLSQLMC